MCVIVFFCQWTRIFSICYSLIHESTSPLLSDRCLGFTRNDHRQQNVAAAATVIWNEKSQWALSFYVDPKRLCQIVQQRKINLEPHNFDGLRPVMQICPLGKRGSVLRSVHLWVRKCVKSRAFLLLHRASSPPLSERRATTNLPTNIHSSVWLVNSVNGA